MSATQTTSTHLCNIISALFNGDNKRHKANLTRSEVYETLTKLQKDYFQIDGGNPTKFLSTTNYHDANVLYAFNVAVGRLIVVTILDLTFVFQSKSDSHVYLADRALF